MLLEHLLNVAGLESYPTRGKTLGHKTRFGYLGSGSQCLNEYLNDLLLGRRT